MKAFAELVATGNGITILNLPVNYGVAPVGLANDRYPFFERILCANGCHQTKLPKLEKLVFDHLPSSASIAERLFSALAEARTTRSVNLLLGGGSKNTSKAVSNLEYIAYALFSKHAHSSIDHLQIEGAVISTADAESVAAVLSAANPSRHIFGVRSATNSLQSESSNPEYLFHDGRYMLREGSLLRFEVVADTEILGEPNIADNDESKRSTAPNAEHDEWKLTTSVVGVRVFQDTDRQCNGKPFVKAVVPGFGVCWVSRQVFADLNSPDALPEKATSGISVLSISFIGSRHAAKGICSLMKLIGSSLTQLMLSIAGKVNLDVICLLKSCPKLTSLTTMGFQFDTPTVVKYSQKHHHLLSELNVNSNIIPV